MNRSLDLLHEFTLRAQTPAEGEQLDVVADVLSDQLGEQMAELEVQLNRLLADVALAATNS